MRTFRTIIFLTSCFWLAAGAARGEPNRNIYFVSEAHVSGSYRDVKVVDDRIYCANGYGVVVWTFDENNPEEPPVEIGRFPTPGIANAIFIDDSLCYVADGSRGLRIYDVSDLSRVEELGAYEETTGFIGVTVGDGVAYLARSRIGIYAVDVSDPTSPSLLGSVQFFTENRRLILQGDYLWATRSLGGYNLTAFDIRNPRNINVAGLYDGSRCGPMFSLNGDTAFVPTDTMHVLNVSDPQNIQVITTFRHRNFVGAIYDNGYLYGDLGTYFSITDVRNMNNIRLAAFTIDSGLESTGMIDFRRDYVFSPAERHGLKIVNVADKSRPRIQHVNLTNGWIRDVAYKDGYIYVADAQTGAWPVPREGDYLRVGRMRVYSVVDPHNPLWVADVDGLLDYYNDGFSQIDLFKDTLVCLSGSERTKLNVFNITDLEHPEHILGGGPNDPQVSAGGSRTFQHEMMFVSGNAGGFTVVSLEDPAHPEVLVNFNSEEGNRHYKIFPEGNYILASGQIFAQTNAIFTYDWSDPQGIRRVGEWARLSGLMAGGIRYHNYLYLVVGLGGVGMSVVNIEDPLRPREVYYTDEVRTGILARVFGGHLFVADFNYGVQVFDLEDPERPRQVGYYDTPGSASGIAVDEERGFLFVADGSNLSIYDVGSLLRVWDLQLAEASHDFGEVGLDSMAVWPLTLINRSEREVVIDSLRIVGEGFTADDVDGVIISLDEELEVWVFFQPDSSREYRAEAVVYSVGRQLKAQLSGRGAPLSAPHDQTLPTEFALHTPYPNPFNSTTVIRYDVPRRSRVRLTVYDLAGREVETLLSGELNPGRHSTIWNNRSNPAGIYFVRFESIEKTTTIKAIMIK